MALPKIPQKFLNRLVIGVLVLLVVVITGKTPSSILPANLLAEIAPSPMISENLVKRVIDGDTIELANGQTVRYIGIDTPERGECYYREATEANKNLILNRKVRLVQDVSSVDKYGRLLRYVYLNKRFVNYYLVRQGFATVSTYPPDVANQELFLEAERLARAEKKGFWGEETCTP